MLQQQMLPSLPLYCSSRGQILVFSLQDGLPQLNLPRSGLSTQIKVPGVGPKYTGILKPSTFDKSQKSGEPEVLRVNSIKVAGDWPVIPLHSTPKLFKGVPQSPVTQVNLSLSHLHSVRAQNLPETVLPGRGRTYDSPGFIYQPVEAGRGTPNPPTHTDCEHLFWKLNFLIILTCRVQTSRTTIKRYFIYIMEYFRLIHLWQNVLQHHLQTINSPYLNNGISSTNLKKSEATWWGTARQSRKLKYKQENNYDIYWYAFQQEKNDLNDSIRLLLRVPSWLLGRTQHHNLHPCTGMYSGGHRTANYRHLDIAS